MYTRWVRTLLLWRLLIGYRRLPEGRHWARSSLNWPDRRTSEVHVPGCLFGGRHHSSCSRRGCSSLSRRTRSVSRRGHAYTLCCGHTKYTRVSTTT
jgi:hypothetical protein